MKRQKTKRKGQTVIAIFICFACILCYRDTGLATEITATLTDAESASPIDAEYGDRADTVTQNNPEVDNQVYTPSNADADNQADVQRNAQSETEDAMSVDIQIQTDSDCELSDYEALNEVREAVKDTLPGYDKKYEGEYHIDYILSHYSYFVRNDLKGDWVADTVGSVVVGNELSLQNTIGKVKAAASYVKYLIDLGDYFTWSWNDTMGIDTNFYYTKSFMTYKEWLTDRMVCVGDDYIDMDTAFSVIHAESEVMLAEGKKSEAAVDKNKNELILDFANTTAVTIKKDDYKSADKIILKNVTGQDMLCHIYTISIEGEDAFVLDTAKIEIDGKGLNDNYFLKLVQDAEECEQGGQYYYGGFGLVWNFPDAKEVTAHFLAGNLVAPNADVTLQGGNHEGQVIANNVQSYSESHFYPYITTEETTTEMTETTTETTEVMTTEKVTTTEAATEDITEKITTEAMTTGETTMEEITTEGTTTEKTATVETATDSEYGTMTHGTSTEILNADITVDVTQNNISAPASESLEVQTGDSIMLYVLVIGLLVSAVGVLLLAICKRRKEK